MSISETLKVGVKNSDEHPEALKTLLFTSLFWYFMMGTLLIFRGNLI